MRLVLDTNVLVAAFATEGACMRLYRHCARRHTLVTAEELVGELEEKLVRKLKIAPADVAGILALYRSECIIVSPSLPEQPICRDPDDDWVIATAVAGTCDCIVSGDADLWSLREHGGIRIVQLVNSGISNRPSHSKRDRKENGPAASTSPRGRRLSWCASPGPRTRHEDAAPT